MAEEQALTKEKIQEKFTALILQLGDKCWQERIAKINQEEIVSEILKLNAEANKLEGEKKSESPSDEVKTVVPEIVK